MNRWSSLALDVVSRLLEADEREVALGDWSESRASGRRALAEALGFVLRRQAGHWRAWRPWLALVTIVIPIGLLSSHAARWWAEGSAMSLFFYAGNWTWSYLASPGARSDVLSTMTMTVLRAMVLVMWSWTAGAAMGSLSRRAVGPTVLLFAITVVGATAGTMTTGRAFGGNAVVYSTVFYGHAVPWLFKATFVLLPAWHGVRCARRQILPLRLSRAVIACAVVVSLTIATRRGLEASLVFGRGALPGAGLDGVVGSKDDLWTLWWLPIPMVWPAVYLLGAAVARRWTASADAADADFTG